MKKKVKKTGSMLNKKLFIKKSGNETRKTSNLKRKFHIPERYDDDKIVLMVVNPELFYVYWETKKETEEGVRKTASKTSLELKKNLRIYTIEDGKTVPIKDIEIVDTARSWYIPIAGINRQKWMVEIGFISEQGAFFSIIRSNVVDVSTATKNDFVAGSDNLMSDGFLADEKSMQKNKRLQKVKKTKGKGYIALVLHAHLPFVKHPEYKSSLEERWLFEAITDTYIPLINTFDGLVEDGVDFRMTLSLSPSLICMLKDEFLVTRYLDHLNKLIHLAELEVKRTWKDKKLNKLAAMYLERFNATKYVFDQKYNKDIVSAFKKFQDLGKLEVITCCATHGYLPFMEMYPTAVKAQVKAAVELYKSVFGKSPRGIWLPECGYQPGHEKILAECGVKYFFVESHGIFAGTPSPKYGVYSPYKTGSGTFVFGRDAESSKAVWSSKEGYPGDYNYREYYRDIGFDLDYDYVRPFINGCGARLNTGIKYHRITGETDEKDFYDRHKALETASVHAGNFLFNREKQIEYLKSTMDRNPIIVAPYDAELFGHWWFEGPDWLGLFLRKVNDSQGILETITPSEYLDEYDEYPSISPSMSSWGWKGYNEMWLNGSNDWIYRHLHKITELMVSAAKQNKNASGITRRVLNQMARELLLAQSSDWAFIMKTGTLSGYAVSRTEEHIGRFLTLNEQLKTGNVDIEMLTESENVYTIFKDIDYSVYG
ncbi:MAG: 1,4-alpha-glucan branching protein domain-containing protein [Candidatus Omnitrophota bacterium]